MITQNGIIATILAESNRDRKKRRTPFKLEDFMPAVRSSKEGKKAQSQQDQLAMAEMLNQLFGGKDNRDVRIRDTGESGSQDNG